MYVIIYAKLSSLVGKQLLRTVPAAFCVKEFKIIRKQKESLDQKRYELNSRPPTHTSLL